MPGKILQLLIICLFTLSVVEGLFVIGVKPVFADPSPTPTDYPTCDLCGWCDLNSTPPAPTPPDWTKCKTCLYNTDGSTKVGKNYTVFGCLSTNPDEFAGSILQILFGIAGGVAFLSVLYGTGVVLTSAGNPEKLRAGKDIIVSSILGLLLIIFSVFLLKVVGYDILKLPAIGKLD